MITWLLVQLLWRWLPHPHPWTYRPRFTLQEWLDGRTPLCRSFDYAGAVLLVGLTTLLLTSCSGATSSSPETFETRGGVRELFCWQGCLYLEAPGLEINNEATEGCFWASSNEPGCVEVATPADATVLVERDCRSACD